MRPKVLPCFFLSPNLLHRPRSFALHLCPPFLHPPLSFFILSFLPQPPGRSFISPSLFKTLFLLSITRWSFRSFGVVKHSLEIHLNQRPCTAYPSISTHHPSSLPPYFIHAHSSLSSLMRCLLPLAPPSFLLSFPGFPILIYHSGKLTPQYTCTDTQHIHCMLKIPTWPHTRVGREYYNE